MNILVLGGTRFLGMRVMKELTKKEHQITVVSRRGGTTTYNSSIICAEREIGLKILEGKYYDLVLDFICYKSKDIVDISERIKAGSYVMISTTWLQKL